MLTDTKDPVSLTCVYVCMYVCFIESKILSYLGNMFTLYSPLRTGEAATSPIPQREIHQSTMEIPAGFGVQLPNEDDQDTLARNW